MCSAPTFLLEVFKSFFFAFLSPRDTSNSRLCHVNCKERRNHRNHKARCNYLELQGDDVAVNKYCENLFEPIRIDVQEECCT